jgi:hypothetical protein
MGVAEGTGYIIGFDNEAVVKHRMRTLSVCFSVPETTWYYPINQSIRVITKLPNSEQSYKGKVKTHNYINRQNQYKSYLIKNCMHFFCFLFFCCFPSIRKRGNQINMLYEIKK